ncbi:MAG TPA: hypothetical protein VEC35_25505 [Noviherbaspirillum sp.]|nr:hypothetical protein [Noviherbaspirillum sp.]
MIVVPWLSVMICTGSPTTNASAGFWSMLYLPCVPSEKSTVMKVGSLLAEAPAAPIPEVAPIPG